MSAWQVKALPNDSENLCMICATCGAVGTPDAKWCPQCFIPYVRAGAQPPAVPTPPASRSGMPWQTPNPVPAQLPPAPMFSPPPYAPSPQFATPTYGPPAGNAFAAPPAAQYTGFAPGYGAVPQAAGTVWPAELGLVVPEYAVATGDLPRICVVTGVPTENMVRMRWLWAPSWTFFLGLLIRYLIADKAAGYLPIHPSVRRKRRQLELSAVLAFVAGLVVMVAGAAGNQPVIALLGAAVVLAGLWTLSVAARPTAPVRRAGPGYLALPKASPAFAAAFRAGRPAGQQPYRQEPLTYKTRKAFVVPAVILALLLVPLGIYGAVQAHNCSAGTVHPNAGVVDADFAYSRGIVAGINAQTGGQGLTPAGAQQLVAEHSRLLAQLQSVHLSRADRAAVDAYAQTMTSYDNALTAAEQRQDDLADQALRDANLQLTNGGQTLSAALHSVSADCAGS